MRVARLYVSATLLVAACSFTSPDHSPTDARPGDDSGGGGIDAAVCADDDNDTVCNAADKCPTKDDRLDADADGVPDGCDDWPCGAKPGDPGDPMFDFAFDGRQWTATPINIGSARRMVVAAGQPYTAGFGWGIRVRCPSGQSSCKAQAEYGYGATRAGCLYDGTVPDDQLFVQGFNAPLTAPATPGVYELRLNAGQRTACGNSQTGWYGGDPGGSSTIAILCVP